MRSTAADDFQENILIKYRVAPNSSCQIITTIVAWTLLRGGTLSLDGMYLHLYLY